MAGIFHTYDVRGIVPTSINEKVAYRMGIAIARHFKTEKIGVGYDARLHSKKLQHYLILGLNKAGVQALDLGMISTPESYFAARFYPSVTVTASHNPKEYNGFKINARGPIAIGLGTGLEKIEDIYRTLEDIDVVDREENAVPTDLREDFCAYMAGKVHIRKPMKVVVDASNGVAGKAMKRIAELAGFTIHLINEEPDGNFPGHGPNPIAKGATDQATELVKQVGADFGAVLDADADRVVIIDDQGTTLSSEQSGSLVLQHILKKHGGEGTIVYDQTTSRLVEETIRKCGGYPIECPVGRTLIMQSMVQHQALYGVETSSHFYFKDFFHQDSSELMILTMLELLSNTDSKLSEIAPDLSKYHMWHDNVHVHDKQAFLDALVQTFPGGNVSHIDGAKITFDSFWVAARPSNTEPVMRFAMEATTQELLDENVAKLRVLIARFH